MSGPKYRLILHELDQRVAHPLHHPGPVPAMRNPELPQAAVSDAIVTFK